jgi:hypothetical protein
LKRHLTLRSLWPGRSSDKISKSKWQTGTADEKPVELFGPRTLVQGAFSKKIENMKTIRATGILIIHLTGLAAMQARAQNHFDVFSGSYTTSTAGPEVAGEGETEIEEMSLSIKVPWENEENDVEVFGVMASSMLLDKEKGDDIRCWSVGLNYSYILKDNDRSLQFTFVPKVNYDFSNGSSGILQLGGLVLATRKKSETFKYKYGLYYNRECFGHFFVPLAGFEWKPNDRWMVYGILPMNATAAFKLSDKVTTGFNFTGIITSFRLEKDRYLHKSTNELYGFADLYILKNLLVQARAGYVLGRSYRIYDAGDKMDIGISALKFGDERRQLNDEIRDGMLYQVGLIYRVKTDK